MPLSILSYQSKSKDYAAICAALSKSQAVIEFDLDGTILTANENFLKALGYSLHEIQGRHHSMFVSEEYRNSEEYKQFWAILAKGEFQAAQYKRYGKGGKEIWIEASYNPIFNTQGKPYKVVKYATDITAQKLQNADYEGKLAAISKSQAVIEFNLDGTIIDANQNFLSAVGYTLEEIRGRHHSMFVEESYRNSAEYRDFWAKLNLGEYQAAQFKRIGKSGNEIWIEASYNPIIDASGRPFKVVKYATDITPQMELLKDVQSLVDKNMAEIAGALHVVSRQSTSASSSSTQTTANVQAVASGAEQLHASVQEIAQNMARSKLEADASYDKVIAAVAETGKLAAAAQAMNGIVELIQNIANQVNLLSLNATIEAARAGEAGKGFAVVANEVKTLARQTSDATAKISEEINGIQSVVGNVVGSLENIQTSIDLVRSYVTSVAGAVEEQSAVAQDMSSNMQVASQAVSDVSESLSEIVSATEIVSGAVKTAQNAAASLVK